MALVSYDRATVNKPGIVRHGDPVTQGIYSNRLTRRLGDSGILKEPLDTETRRHGEDITAASA